MVGDSERVRLALAEHLPTYLGREIRLLGTGLDHVSYLAGGDLVIRLRRTDGLTDRPEGPRQLPPGSAGHAERLADHVDGRGGAANDPRRPAVHREAAVLAVVGRHTRMAVPAPLVATHGVLAYRALPGVPLLTEPRIRRRAWSAAIGATLGAFLAELQTIPESEFGGDAGTDDDPPEDWLAEAAECYSAARATIPHSAWSAIERFLDAAPPPAAGCTAFGHNDLGAEHVLVDPDTGTVTGVIDWSDAGFADPAIDLGLLLRDLGPAGYRAAIARGTWREHRIEIRARFYARCRVLEDLRFAVQRNRPEYRANGIAALPVLFAE